jgi:Cu/Ag efflux pump CusA
VAAGIYGLLHTSLDAIPELSDVQVIIYADWEGRSPDLIEDQITYPISARFISAPKVKFVRGESMFGKSFVYVILEDGTDIYWARSRVLEYLNSARGSLPANVNPVIGPDATGVGWVYEYALIDKSGKHSLADLRSFQDWTLRYALESVKGVSEVASLGGFVKQYQVDLDPNALIAYNLSVKDIASAIQSSNNDVGGKTSEVATTEYFVRGHGYIRGPADIEDIVLKVQNGTPVYVKNIARVHLGGDLRRGVAELDGKGEVVGGIVVMRIRGKITPEAKNPVNRFLIWVYQPCVNFVLRHRKLTLALAFGILAATAFPFLQLGKEFMPPLNEGDILYMPTAVPGMSVTEATQTLQIQDRMIRKLPEVQSVFGKAGQAESSTDPAPLSMFETVVQLKPSEEWRAGMTWDKLIAEMNANIKTPGMANIFWMPIQTRTEMLTTGFRSQLGIKVFGKDLGQIQNVSIQIEHALADFPDTRSAFAERTTGGYFLDFTVDRKAAARYGLRVGGKNRIQNGAAAHPQRGWPVGRLCFCRYHEQ